MRKSKQQPQVALAWLWWVYGYTYDGLLDFYPYTTLLEQVLDQAEIGPADSVLDLGCGTGNALSLASGLTKQLLVGVDSSSSMLKVARKKLSPQTRNNHIQLQHSDMLGFLRGQPKGKFDRIITINVIYALERREQIWAEIMRVMAKDGALIVSTPVKTGSRSLIQDQIKHKGIVRSLKPRLIGVFLIDSLINIFGDAKKFSFPSEDTLLAEIAGAGGAILERSECYGGVGVLLKIKRIKPH